MKVIYKIKSQQFETAPAECEVPDFKLIHHPDGSRTSTAQEIDAVEETLCDIARNFVTVQWKLQEESDIWYRDAEFPEWSDIKALRCYIERLEKEKEELKREIN